MLCGLVVDLNCDVWSCVACGVGVVLCCVVLLCVVVVWRCGGVVVCVMVC